jgi:hypothetical protein
MDYQLLATQYKVGDSVKPFGATTDQVGRIVSLWPAIGMVDVNFPTGTRRFPVEEITKVDESTEHLKYPAFPAGPTVSVSGGPFPQESGVCRRIVLGHLLSRVK